jgi:hypothetical protein
MSWPNTSMRRAAAIAILALSAAALASCGGSGSAIPPALINHVLTGPTRSQSAETLDVTSGAQTVHVEVGHIGGALFRVETSSHSGLRPVARFAGSTLRVAQASSGHGSGPDILTVLLSPGVRWTINLNGGSSQASVDLVGGALTTLSFGKGVSTATVRLPAPVGSEMVRLLGGATSLSIVAPSKAPARVTAGGGASQVVFEGVRHVGVAGGTVFDDTAWATAINRYTIDLASGVSVFRFSRTT